MYPLHTPQSPEQREHGFLYLQLGHTGQPIW